MKPVLLSLFLSLPALATTPAELQPLFDHAQYQQLLQKIAEQPNAEQDPTISLLQAKALIQQQQREEADTLLNELLVAYPEHSALLTTAALNKLVLAGSGSVFNARKRATDALELLHKAIEHDPRNFQAQQSLLNFYQTAPANAGGSKEIAAERAAAIQLLDPVQGSLALATIAASDTRLKDALQLIERQLKLTPEQPDLLLRKAALLSQQSAFLVAQETYIQALPQLTDVAQRYSTLFQIGRLGVFTNQYQDEAISALEQYLAFYQDSQQPRLNRARLRLAQLYLSQGKPEKAKELYELIADVASDEQDFIDARTELANKLAAM